MIGAIAACLAVTSAITVGGQVGDEIGAGELVGQHGVPDGQAADVLFVEVDVRAELLVLVPEFGELAANWVQPLTFPPVSTTDNGRPCPSQARWILVVGPPPPTDR